MFDYLYRKELEKEAEEKAERMKLGSKEFKRRKISPEQQLKQDKQNYLIYCI